MLPTHRFLITIAAAALFAVSASAGATSDRLNDRIDTRYGSVRVSESGTLLVNDRIPNPTVKANSSLYVVESFDLGQQVLVMTMNLGGTACPALFNFVTLDARGARTFPTFGTCSDLYQVRQANKSVIVTMPAQYGTSEYVFAEGVLTENGQVVPPLGAQPFSAGAIINDPDGYTNVRSQPNGKSPIIARVSKDEMFDTHPQNGDWWQVKLPGGATGYMHRSRIVLHHQF